MQIITSRLFRLPAGSPISAIKFMLSGVRSVLSHSTPHLDLVVSPLYSDDLVGSLDQNFPSFRPIQLIFNGQTLRLTTTRANINNLIMVLSFLEQRDYIAHSPFLNIKQFIENTIADPNPGSFNFINALHIFSERAPNPINISSHLIESKDGKIIDQIKAKFDYYAILEISKIASQTEIKAAYIRLAKLRHPDKSKKSNANEEFSLLQEAYSTLIDPKKRVAYEFEYSYLQQPLLINPPFINPETFLSLTSVDDINADNLIVLDDYAFDIDELVEYARQDIYKLYRNPHIIDRDQNADFSETAKNKMKSHPRLSSYTAEIENRLVSQKKGIKPQTVDALITMLNKFSHEGEDGRFEAREFFLQHCQTLTAEEKYQLDNFVIRMPCIQGGFQPLTFNQVVMGGENASGCIFSAQTFGWQFVVTVRPIAIGLVPQSVKDIARRQYNKIEVPLEIMAEAEPSLPLQPSSALHQTFSGSESRAEVEIIDPSHVLTDEERISVEQISRESVRQWDDLHFLDNDDFPSAAAAEPRRPSQSSMYLAFRRPIRTPYGRSLPFDGEARRQFMPGIAALAAETVSRYSSHFNSDSSFIPSDTAGGEGRSSSGGIPRDRFLAPLQVGLSHSVDEEEQKSLFPLEEIRTASPTWRTMTPTFFGSLNHSRQLQEPRSTLAIRETVNALSGHGITEQMIRDWQPQRSRQFPNAAPQLFSSFERDILIYLVTGQPQGISRPNQIPAGLRLSPLQAIQEINQLSLYQLRALGQNFIHGLRGHHLRSWQAPAHEEVFMFWHVNALETLIQRQNLSPSIAIERINGITHDEAWNIALWMDGPSFRRGR